MAINFDNIFGIHTQALSLRSRRSEILASNLANADTPKYKAQDLEFNTTLRHAQGQQVDLNSTRAGHLPALNSVSGGHLKYRIPTQAALDGNTVEAHIEQANFNENTLRYQTSLRFVNGRLSGLKLALKGE